VDYGVERKILEKLEFKSYCNSPKIDYLPPNIHVKEKIDWDSTEQLRKVVEGQSKHRPMLIYALENTRHFENV
jgi:hypothetical protein